MTLMDVRGFLADVLEVLFLLMLTLLVGIAVCALLVGGVAGGVALVRSTRSDYASPASVAMPPTSSAVTTPDEVEYAVADTKGQIICWCDLTGCYAAPGVTQAPMPAEGPHVP